MSIQQKRSRLWWFIVLSTTCVAVLLIVSYLGWNSRTRPPSISGVWYLDDLRTSEEESQLVTFSATGEYKGDTGFGTRWSYRDGKIYFRTWQLEDASPLNRMISNTTLYSWFAETDEFPLTAQFSEDGLVLTLIAEGEGPRCRLRRADP